MIPLQRRRRVAPLHCMVVCFVLAVNSGRTAAWLTPTPTVVVTSTSVSASSNSLRRRSLTSAASSITAASSSSNSRLKHTAPRRALEVMADGDQHHSPLKPTTRSEPSSAVAPATTTSDDDIDDKGDIAASSETLSIFPQLQRNDLQVQLQLHSTQLSVVQNHPVMKRLLGDDDDELSVQQKAINLLFLSAAFGYAIYTIFNIDNGMTRGWTVQEQVMRIPLDNWGAYESYLANKPVMTKTLINVIIYLLGDWLSQTAFQKKHFLNFDISRTLRNGFIGLCFGPLVHQYYEFSDAILPPENGLVTRLEKIFMDQTIYLTVKCSIYISAVGLLAGEDWGTVRQTVKDKIRGVVLTAWKFWPIVHCITYSLIPAQHRILWVNCVDLVWNAILATAAGGKESVFEEVDEEALAASMPTVSAFGEPLTGSSLASNATEVTFVIIDDVSEDPPLNSTSANSAEAVVV